MGLLTIIRKVKAREREMRLLMVYARAPLPVSPQIGRASCRERV